ncbi:MAG TPA: FAD-dependent monooxygenase [Xanthobacteraceae bacterium]|nr:FAD-dependent monooxygenase [Xanthobacteraceae bacterium]
MQRRAVVIGGSISGLLAAHLLRDIGWDAFVFERNEVKLSSRGAGLSTQVQLRDIMRRLGVPFDESMGIQVDRLICLDRCGNVVLEKPTARNMSAWARLYSALLAKLPADKYRLGMTFVRAEQKGDGVTAVFADGTRVCADLLIGADGVRSTVREQFLPALQPDYAGYVAWRAMIAEEQVPARGREIFDVYTFCLPEGELFLGYPVPGRNDETRIGHRAYNIVWYRPAPADSVLVELCTDAAGRRHGSSIPPPLIRREVISEVKTAARDLIAPQAAVIFAAAQPFFQPIFDLESPQLVFGRVVLIGDAAFVARPHVGAGVTKAALDAECLADALRAAGGDIEGALASYERGQLAFGRGLVALGREEGGYLSAHAKAHTQPGDGALHRDAESVVEMHNSRTAKIQRLVASRGMAYTSSREQSVASAIQDHGCRVE